MAGILPYLRRAASGTQCEREELSEDTRYNEFVMTALRTADGVDTAGLGRKFGARKLQYFLVRAERFVRTGVLIRDDERYYIPPGSYLISDGIIADLFIA